jgi:hypothetical protein
MIVCGQGKSITQSLQLRSGPPDRAPLTGIFDGSEPLSGLIWPAGATPASSLPATPNPVWIDGASGTVSYQLTSAASATIPPGDYRTSVSAMVGGESIDLIETDLVIYAVGLTAAIAGPSPVPGPDATALALVPTLYCSDEHIYVRCRPDFTALWPPSQLLAQGTDGIFAADPWTLTSASNDFTSQGVAIGDMVWFKRPASAFPAGGILMAISAVSGSSLTLRRAGLPANFGMPPAPAGGLVGVDFQICTFKPQSENATYELNQRYSIDATLPGRSPADMTDVRVLRDTCVTMVLIDCYSDESRTTAGDYAPKVAMLEARLGDLQAALTIRWLPDNGEDRVTDWFSTRIVR